MVTKQRARTREIDVTSYAEIVLASPADDLAHPVFGKLFLETEYVADSAALLCHRRARDPRDPPVWAMHVLSLEGRPQGPVEGETDRARFIGRGRNLDKPMARFGRARTEFARIRSVSRACGPTAFPATCPSFSFVSSETTT